MAQKKKKPKFKLTLLLVAPLLIILLVLVAGASSSSVSTEGGRQESVVNAQTSILDEYLEKKSAEQAMLESTVQSEIEARNTQHTAGGDAYIKSLKPARFAYEKKKQQNAAKTKDNPNPEDKPLNLSWHTYFVGQMIKKAGLDISNWSVDVSTFATKLHLDGNFTVDPNYIPRCGDIIFFGKKISHLSDGQVIKAKYCGIVTNVEIIKEKTTITAMRLTVAEGDVEGDIVNGLYNHSTAVVKEHQYDLYDSKGNNYHASPALYEPIMGYGTVVSDKKSVESTDDTSDYEHLVYTIDLKSTFEEAKQRGEAA